MKESRPHILRWLVVCCLLAASVAWALCTPSDAGPLELVPRGDVAALLEPQVVDELRERVPVVAPAAEAAPREPRCVARIIALDDNLQQVPSVEVWLARRLTGGDGFESSPEHLRGITGADGAVTFDDLPEGKLLVHARHETLVHSLRRRKQMNLRQPNAVVVAGSEPVELTVYLSMPVVCGLQMVGLQIFYHSFYNSDAGYHGPTSGDGHWTISRIQQRLQAAFPGALFQIAVKDFRPPRSGRYGSTLLTAWAVGYEAFRQEVMPVAVDAFIAPVQVAPWQVVPSDQFGSILVTLEGAGGIPVAGLCFSIGTPMRAGRHDRPEVRYMPIATGVPVELPVGTYDLQCEGEFTAQHPALSRRGLDVRRGEVTEVVIDSEIAWSRCRFRFRGAGEPRALVGGGIHLKHLATGLEASKLIHSYESPIELWLPDGEYEVRATALPSDRDMIWRFEQKVLAVHGGTLESPQLVEREMSLVRR